MHNTRINFTRILEIIKDIISDGITENGNYLRRGTMPKFFAKEVIVLGLTTEYLCSESENYFFKVFYLFFGKGCIYGFFK